MYDISMNPPVKNLLNAPVRILSIVPTILIAPNSGSILRAYMSKAHPYAYFR